MSFFSNFVLALKFAKQIMFNYKEATKEQATVKESLYYLFLILIIPSALSVLFFHVTSYPVLQEAGLPPSELLRLSEIGGGPQLPGSVLEDPYANLPPQVGLILNIFNFYQLYPLVFLSLFFGLIIVSTIVSLTLLAGFMQILAKALRVVQGNYSNTLAALVYGATPGIMISWLSTPLSLLFGSLGDGIIGIATFIWGVTIGITALENQHRISAGRALFVYFLPVIIIVIVTTVLIFVVLTPAVFPSLLFLWFGQDVETEPISTPQEEFIELTSRFIEVVDASCVPGSAYYVTVRNLDQINEIDTSEIVLEIDDQIVSEVFWEPTAVIPAGDMATVSIFDFVGEAGSIHVIKATGPNGRSIQVPVVC